MDRHHVDRAALPGVRERALLRHRLRTLFATHSCDADHRSAHPAAVAALWRHLAADGIAALGAEPARGGLREATIAMQELGRAACTLPLLGHLLGNLVLARERAAPLLDARVRERLHGGALRMTIAFTPGDDGGTPLLRGDRASGLFRGGEDTLLESVAVDAFPLPSATLADLRLLAALLAVARRQGQGRRARDALGAADPVSCERLRSAVDRAAESFDFGRPRWREQAAHAVALAVDGPGVASWWPGRAAARASALPAALT
jgi:hypothetical protein